MIVRYNHEVEVEPRVPVGVKGLAGLTHLYLERCLMYHLSRRGSETMELELWKQLIVSLTCEMRNISLQSER